MPPVISFIGYHNSGKTTFATKVVKILKDKGYKVGVLKSTKHRNLIGDTPGKDSYRYREAGADSVGIVSPDELVLFKKINREDINLNLLSLLLFNDYDIVICEGFKSSEVPKIEVLRKEIQEEPLYRKISNVIAVISDVPVEGIKRFKTNEHEEVSQFIEENFIKNPTRVFFLNGKEMVLDEDLENKLKNAIIKALNLKKEEGERINLTLLL